MSDEIVECSKCGSKYAITWKSVIMRDKDSQDCSVCKTVIYTWDGSSIPSFRLVERQEPRALD